MIFCKFICDFSTKYYEFMMDTKIAIFKGIKVRKTIHKKEWWFVVEDVVYALTDTVNAKDYIKKFRNRDKELSKG